MRPACCQANWVTAFWVLHAPMYASRATSFVYAAHVSASKEHAPPLTAWQHAFASMQTSHPTSEPGRAPPVPASTVPPVVGGGGGGGVRGTPRRRHRTSDSEATPSSSAVVASPQPLTVNVQIDTGTSAASNTPIQRFIPTPLFALLRALLRSRRPRQLDRGTIVRPARERRGAGARPLAPQPRPLQLPPFESEERTGSVNAR